MDEEKEEVKRDSSYFIEKEKDLQNMSEDDRISYWQLVESEWDEYGKQFLDPNYRDVFNPVAADRMLIENARFGEDSAVRGIQNKILSRAGITLGEPASNNLASVIQLRKALDILQGGTQQLQEQSFVQQPSLPLTQFNTPQFNQQQVQDDVNSIMYGRSVFKSQLQYPNPDPQYKHDLTNLNTAMIQYQKHKQIMPAINEDQFTYLRNYLSNFQNVINRDKNLTADKQIFSFGDHLRNIQNGQLQGELLSLVNSESQPLINDPFQRDNAEPVDLYMRSLVSTWQHQFSNPGIRSGFINALIQQNDSQTLENFLVYESTLKRFVGERLSSSTQFPQEQPVLKRLRQEFGAEESFQLKNQAIQQEYLMFMKDLIQQDEDTSLINRFFQSPLPVHYTSSANFESAFFNDYTQQQQQQMTDQLNKQKRSVTFQEEAEQFIQEQQQDAIQVQNSKQTPYEKFQGLRKLQTQKVQGKRVSISRQQNDEEESAMEIQIPDQPPQTFTLRQLQTQRVQGDRPSIMRTHVPGTRPIQNRDPAFVVEGDTIQSIPTQTIVEQSQEKILDKQAEEIVAQYRNNVQQQIQNTVQMNNARRNVVYPNIQTSKNVMVQQTIINKLNKNNEVERDYDQDMEFTQKEKVAKKKDRVQRLAEQEQQLEAKVRKQTQNLIDLGNKEREFKDVQQVDRTINKYKQVTEQLDQQLQVLGMSGDNDQVLPMQFAVGDIAKLTIVGDSIRGEREQVMAKAQSLKILSDKISEEISLQTLQFDRQKNMQAQILNIIDTLNVDGVYDEQLKAIAAADNYSSFVGQAKAFLNGLKYETENQFKTINQMNDLQNELAVISTTRDTIYQKQNVDYNQLYTRMAAHVPMPTKHHYDQMTDQSKQQLIFERIRVAKKMYDEQQSTMMKLDESISGIQDIQLAKQDAESRLRKLIEQQNDSMRFKNLPYQIEIDSEDDIDDLKQKIIGQEQQIKIEHETATIKYKETEGILQDFKKITDAERQQTQKVAAIYNILEDQLQQITGMQIDSGITNNGDLSLQETVDKLKELQQQIQKKLVVKQQIINNAQTQIDSFGVQKISSELISQSMQVQFQIKDFQKLDHNLRMNGIVVEELTNLNYKLNHSNYEQADIYIGTVHDKVKQKLDERRLYFNNYSKMADDILQLDKSLLAERITIQKKVKDSTDRIYDKFEQLGYAVTNDIRSSLMESLDNSNYIEAEKGLRYFIKNTTDLLQKHESSFNSVKDILREFNNIDPTQMLRDTEEQKKQVFKTVSKMRQFLNGSVFEIKDSVKQIINNHLNEDALNGYFKSGGDYKKLYNDISDIAKYFELQYKQTTEKLTDIKKELNKVSLENVQQLEVESAVISKQLNLQLDSLEHQFQKYALAIPQELLSFKDRPKMLLNDQDLKGFVDAIDKTKKIIDDKSATLELFKRRVGTSDKDVGLSELHSQRKELKQYIQEFKQQIVLQFTDAQIPIPQSVQYLNSQQIESLQFQQVFQKIINDVKQSVRERAELVSDLLATGKNINIDEVIRVQNEIKSFDVDVKTKTRQLTDQLNNIGATIPQEVYALQTLRPVDGIYQQSLLSLSKKMKDDVELIKTQLQTGRQVIQDMNLENVYQAVREIGKFKDDIYLKFRNSYHKLAQLGLQFPQQFADLINSDIQSDPQWVQKLLAANDQKVQIDHEVEIQKQRLQKGQNLIREISQTIENSTKELYQMEQGYKEAANNLGSTMLHINTVYGTRFRTNNPLSSLQDIQQLADEASQFLTRKSKAVSDSRLELQRLQIVSDDILQNYKVGKESDDQLKDLMIKVKGELLNSDMLDYRESVRIRDPKVLIKVLDQVPVKLAEKKQQYLRLADAYSASQQEISEIQQKISQTESFTDDISKLVAKREVSLRRMLATNQALDRQRQLAADLTQAIQNRTLPVNYYDQNTLNAFNQIQNNQQLDQFINTKMQNNRYSEQVRRELWGSVQQSQLDKVNNVWIQGGVIAQRVYSHPKLYDIGQRIEQISQNVIKQFFEAKNVLSLQEDPSQKVQHGFLFEDALKAEKEAVAQYQIASSLIDSVEIMQKQYQNFADDTLLQYHQFRPTDTAIEETIFNEGKILGMTLSMLQQKVKEHISKAKQMYDDPERIIRLDELAEYKQQIDRDIIPLLQQVNQSYAKDRSEISQQVQLRTINQATASISERIKTQFARDQAPTIVDVNRMKGLAETLAGAYNQIFINLGAQYFVHGHRPQFAERQVKDMFADALRNRSIVFNVNGINNIADYAEDTVRKLAGIFKREIIEKISDKIAPNISQALERVDTQTFSELLSKAQDSPNGMISWISGIGVQDSVYQNKFKALKETALQELTSQLDFYNITHDKYANFLHRNIQQARQAISQDQNQMKEQLSYAAEQRLVKNDRLLGINILGKRNLGSIYDTPTTMGSFLQTEQYIRKAPPQDVQRVKQDMQDFRNKIEEQKIQSSFDYTRNNNEVLQNVTRLREGFLKDIMPAMKTGIFNYGFDFNQFTPAQRVQYYADFVMNSPRILALIEAPIQEKIQNGLPLYKENILDMTAALTELRTGIQDITRYVARQPLNNPDPNLTVQQQRAMAPVVNNIAANQMFNKTIQLILDKEKEYNDYQNVFQQSQIDMLDRLDNIIAQQEGRNNSYGALNEIKQQIGSDIERMSIDMLKNYGMSGVTQRNMQEQIYRHVARAGNMFRENGIPAQFYEQRRLNMYQAPRDLQDNKTAMLQNDYSKNQKQITPEILQVVQGYKLISLDDLNFIKNITVEQNKPYKIVDGQKVPLTDEEKVRASKILIDILVILFVYHLKTISKEQAQQQKQQLSIQNKKGQIFQKLISSINQAFQK